MQPAACRASPQGAPFTRARPVFCPSPHSRTLFLLFPAAFLPAFSALSLHPFSALSTHLFAFLRHFLNSFHTLSAFRPRLFYASPASFSAFTQISCAPLPPFPHLFFALLPRLFRFFPASFPRFPRTLAPPAARPACPFFRSCFASAQANKTVR